MNESVATHEDIASALKSAITEASAQLAEVILSPEKKVPTLIKEVRLVSFFQEGNENPDPPKSDESATGDDENKNDETKSSEVKPDEEAKKDGITSAKSEHTAVVEEPHKNMQSGKWPLA